MGNTRRWATLDDGQHSTMGNTSRWATLDDGQHSTMERAPIRRLRLVHRGRGNVGELATARHALRLKFEPMATEITNCLLRVTNYLQRLYKIVIIGLCK